MFSIVLYCTIDYQIVVVGSYHKSLQKFEFMGKLQKILLVIEGSCKKLDKLVRRQRV